MEIYKTYEIKKKLTQTAIEFYKDGSMLKEFKGELKNENSNKDNIGIYFSKPLWKDNNTLNIHRIYIMYINENDIIVEIIHLRNNATKYFKKYIIKAIPLYVTLLEEYKNDLIKKISNNWLYYFLTEAIGTDEITIMPDLDKEIQVISEEDAYYCVNCKKHFKKFILQNGIAKCPECKQSEKIVKCKFCNANAENQSMEICNKCAKQLLGDKECI